MTRRIPITYANDRRRRAQWRSIRARYQSAADPDDNTLIGITGSAAYIATFRRPRRGMRVTGPREHTPAWSPTRARKAGGRANNLALAAMCEARADAATTAEDAAEHRRRAAYFKGCARRRSRAYIYRYGWHFYCHVCARRMTATAAILPRKNPPAGEVCPAYCERCAKKKRLKVWDTSMDTRTLDQYPYYR